MSKPTSVVVVLVVVGLLIVFVGRADPPLLLPLPDGDDPVAAWLPDGTPLWVVATDDGARVLEAWSPRYDLGVRELVGWCPGSQRFLDTLHSSRWLPDGQWASGRATHGLAAYEATVLGNGIDVHGDRVPPAQRGDAEPAPFTGGADCDRDRSDTAVFHDLDERPVPTIAEEAATDETLTGTLMARQDMPLLFCAVPSWVGAVDACPVELVPTDAQHAQSVGADWIDATFLAREVDGVLRDVRLLPATNGNLVWAPPEPPPPP